jgi:hypothetical protein
MPVVEFPAKIFGFKVEKRLIPRPGGQKLFFNSHTQIGVLHTTESSSLEASFKELNKNHSAPHFIVGDGRIIQCRPLNRQGAALKGNGPCFANAEASIQIEMVGFTGGGKDSKTTTDLWLPKDGVLLPTVAIMAYCAGNEIDIPLQVPNDKWKDDASDMPLPWASGPTPKKPKAKMNTRRIAAAAGDFPKLKGWWMHVEIPCQGPTWHHDCGRLRRRDMLRMALELLSKGK